MSLDRGSNYLKRCQTIFHQIETGMRFRMFDNVEAPLEYDITKIDEIMEWMFQYTRGVTEHTTLSASDSVWKMYRYLDASIKDLEVVHQAITVLHDASFLRLTGSDDLAEKAVSFMGDLDKNGRVTDCASLVEAFDEFERRLSQTTTTGLNSFNDARKIIAASSQNLNP